VLNNPKQLSEMRRSWGKIDFESVRNQSALVCNCRHEDLVQLLEVEFFAILDGLTKSGEPVRDIMSWADKCCDRLMRSGRNTMEDRSTLSSRSVLIRWGYVTSQIMRDLTIRSDPAFGAFQILKLFLDDWIALNVLRNVALSTNSVAASVEPVMQQQFFTLSPMAGQESFGNIEVRSSQQVMSHTPTTSNMLAALQQESFLGGSLDPSGHFSSDAYNPMSYMDTAGTADDVLPNQGGLFSDYVSGNPGTFDLTSTFTPQDLPMGSSETPGSRDGDKDGGQVKTASTV